MVAKTANESLTLLGVDGTKNPTVSRYPKAYNPKALRHWVRALDKVAQNDDTLDTWMKTIREFLMLCKKADISPFDHASTQATNQGITDWLKSNRVKAIKYCADTELFKKFTVSFSRRTATVTGREDRGFLVQNVGRLKANDDPTLPGWLATNPLPGFTKTGDGAYAKEINAATHITINFIGNGAATVTLTIHCHSLPSVPGTRTNKEMARYIETNVWMPLIRKYPFVGVNKLF